MSPKEYLLSIGAIDKITRGRLSLANIEKCKAGAAKGVQIDGYAVSKPTAATPKDAPVVVEKVKPTVSAKEVADIGDARYDERDWEAVAPDGSKVSLREVCGTCGASFTYHRCDDPWKYIDNKKTKIVIRARRG